MLFLWKTIRFISFSFHLVYFHPPSLLLLFCILTCFNILPKIKTKRYPQRRVTSAPSLLLNFPCQPLVIINFIVFWFILLVIFFFFGKKSKFMLFSRLFFTFKGKVLFHLSSLYWNVYCVNHSIFIEIALSFLERHSILLRGCIVVYFTSLCLHI